MVSHIGEILDTEKKLKLRGLHVRLDWPHSMNFNFQTTNHITAPQTFFLIIYTNILPSLINIKIVCQK